MKKNAIGKNIVAVFGGEKKMNASIAAGNFRYFEAGVSFMFKSDKIDKIEVRLNAAGMFDVIFFAKGRIAKIDAEIFSGELKESFERETGVKI